MAIKTFGFLSITVLLSAFLFHQLLYDIIADNIDLWGNEMLTKVYLPDFVIRIGVRMSLKQRVNELDIKVSNTTINAYVGSFVDQLKQKQLTAKFTQQANEQHYEVDSSFYNKVLGFYNKYSSGQNRNAQKVYTNPPSVALDTNALNQSEIDMLDIYIERAQLCVGDDCKLNVLDLGCGWGSFSLYYASKCAFCNIVSISNSDSQIAFIKQRANELGLKNIFPREINVNEFNKIHPMINHSNLFSLISANMVAFNVCSSSSAFSSLSLFNVKKTIKRILDIVVLLFLTLLFCSFIFNAFILFFYGFLWSRISKVLIQMNNQCLTFTI